ncbi:Uncharacterized protein ybeR [Salmonella enterica subsp. enterica serovar Thompson]|nr:Uncharacterized protein ybeR [Salmonella enterica subsp. enterica serovar Thompson]
MDKEEQYLLFALSTPMEVLYIGNEPSHTSPAMYTGIPAVDLSDSWGIDNREDLIQTIYRMTDDGHAADLAPFYIRWFTLSPHQWREFTAQLSEQGQIYARFVAETALCCGAEALKPGTMCVWGFYAGWGC